MTNVVLSLGGSPAPKDKRSVFGLLKSKKTIFSFLVPLNCEIKGIGENMDAKIFYHREPHKKTPFSRALNKPSKGSIFITQIHMVKVPFDEHV